MCKHEFQTFSSQKIECDAHCSLSMEQCRFIKGSVIVSKYNKQFYDLCHFKAGSTLVLTGQVDEILFTNCLFDAGSMVELTCRSLILEMCTIPKGVLVFNGTVLDNLQIVRSSFSDPVPLLPKCHDVYLHDGLTNTSRWEITKPFRIPTKTSVTYFNISSLKNPKSLDVLIRMMWRYPRLTVSSLFWSGNTAYMKEFQKTSHHPFRQQASVILVFLGARKRKVCPIPEELIRELLGYLI